MGKNRYINSDFWNDTWIIDKLTPLEQHLFMYLLTNQRANLCGVYELSARIMAVQTGMDKTEIEAMLERMKPKVFYVDGWIIVANSIKHQNYTNEKILAGIYRELATVPEHLLQHVKWPVDFDKKEVKGQQQTSILDDSSITHGRPMEDMSHLTIPGMGQLKPNGNNSTAAAPSSIPDGMDMAKPTTISRKEFFARLVHELGFTVAVKPTVGRMEKMRLRLKQNTPEELLIAARNIGADAYLQGDNPGSKRYGDIDYLLRNDEIVNKWATKGEDSQGLTEDFSKEYA